MPVFIHSLRNWSILFNFVRRQFHYRIPWWHILIDFPHFVTGEILVRILVLCQQIFTQTLTQGVAWSEGYAFGAQFYFVIFHYQQHQYGDSANFLGKSGISVGPTADSLNIEMK